MRFVIFGICLICLACTNTGTVQAIGARNLLKSYAKQREAQQEQLRALIVEKKSELDRFLESSFGIFLVTSDRVKQLFKIHFQALHPAHCLDQGGGRAAGVHRAVHPPEVDELQKLEESDHVLKSK